MKKGNNDKGLEKTNLGRLLQSLFDENRSFSSAQNVQSSAQPKTVNFPAHLKDLIVFLQPFANSISDAFFFKDDNLRLILVNNTFCQLSGYSLKTLISGETNPFPEPVLNKFSSIERKVLANGEPAESIERFKLGCKKEIYVLIRWNSMRFNGRLFVAGTMKELSERENTQNALFDSEERFNAFMKNSPTTAYIKDSHGRWIYINEAFAKLFGFNDESWKYKSDVDLWPGETARNMQENDKKIIDSGSACSIEEIILHNEKEFHLLTYRFPFKNRNGEVFIGGMGIDITYLKDTERRLRENQMLLMRAEQVSHIGNFEIDIDKDTIKASDEVFRIFGVPNPQREIRFDEILQLVHPNDRAIVRRTIIETFAGRRKYPVEFRIFHALNNKVKQRTVSAVADTLLSHNNGTRKLVGTLQDVTDRKKEQEDLLLSKNRYKSLFEHSPISIWEQDFSEVFAYLMQLRESGVSDFRTYLTKWPVEVQRIAAAARVMHVNQKTLEILEAPNKETIFKKYASGLYDSNYAVIKEMLICLAEGKGKYEAELPVVSLAGNPLTLFMNLFVTPGCEANLSRVTVSYIDITARKKTEQALQKSKANLKALFDSSQLTYYLIDPQFRIITFNKRAYEESLHHYNKKLTKYSRIFDYLNLNDAELFKDCFERAAIGERIRFEKQVTFNSGLQIWYEWSFAPAYDLGGFLIGVAFGSSDIGERKKAQQELLRTKEKAEESDRLKSAFLANMSHEIRTPMNGILGFAQILKSPDLSRPEQEEFLDIILNRGNHLLTLINDIIDISKIEAGQLVVSETECSLNNLLNEQHSFFKTQISIEKAQPIELKIKKGLPDPLAFILCDSTKLQQVLTNLLSNAIKFTEEGTIEFGYELLQDKTLRFYVRDSGIGLSIEQQSIIFDRFRQADDSTNRKYGGAGLGLAISKGLLNLMEGHIWVESEMGKGSCFYFSLPYKPVHVSRNKLSFPNEYKTKFNWNAKTILIVEDDDSGYRFLREVLIRTQARLIRAVNGSEAINQCQNNSAIDLVLMDIQMPGINGFEATRVIKESRKDLPIIAQTANVLDEDRERCFEAGCDAFISKPVDIKNLLATIDKYFNKQPQRTEKYSGLS